VHGLIIRSGAVVDATLSAATVKSPYDGSGFNKPDTNARFMVKRPRPIRLQGASGGRQGERLVRQANMTSANLHDKRTAEALIRATNKLCLPTRPTPRFSRRARCGTTAA